MQKILAYNNKLEMNTKIKTLLHQLLHSPQRFPVEAVLGVLYYVILVYNMQKVKIFELSDDIIFLYVPILALTFWLQKVDRVAYFASFFLSIFLLSINITPFLWTSGFYFTYVLAAILLIVGYRRMDNRSFVAHAIHVATQMFFGLLITGILTLAVFAIVRSFFYIFNIDSFIQLFEYILLFIWIVMAPQICCTLIRQDEDDVSEPAKITRIILDYIMSPAVIIYTFILYLYFIKIAFQWELPKGGVAWMVMGFISVAIAGRMSQAILSKRHYDWFYRHFTLIAIPPLILYWIGSIYRIRLYSFTEDRVYLIVAGVLMTFNVLLLYKERTRRYQLMTILMCAVIILFTYIPGISAKSIGIRCQKQRLNEYLTELKLTNPKTGKLFERLDLRSISRDSLMCARYKEACSVINYVKDEIGEVEFYKTFGNWNYREYQFYHIKSEDKIPTEEKYLREKQVKLDDYSIMLSDLDYELNFENGIIYIERKGAIELEYPINSMLQQENDYLNNIDNLMSYRNDSLLLVLDGFSVIDSTIIYVSHTFSLFKKQ